MAFADEHWQRVSRGLDRALELDPGERAAWLARLRDDEPTVAAEVEALLAGQGAIERDGFLAGRAALPDVAATLRGRRLGAYTLQEPIGQGGMGSVWRAVRSDGNYRASVAVKLLNLALIGARGVARFRREGSILARLQHPHIAHLLDAGVTDEGQPYLVLELVEGETLDVHCRRAALTVEQRLRLFLDVLAAVAHAHAHLVVHRDLKPVNVLVMADGRVKLLDFGIAKLLEDESEAGDATALTREGMRALTPQYAAPEQLQGGTITTATDVYALGVMLYELLCGRHPSGGARVTAAEVMRATLDEEPLRPSLAGDLQARQPSEDATRIAGERGTSPAALQRQLSGDLDNIVAKALRKRPEERYASVDALADDLQRHLAHEPVGARADSLGYRVAKFVRRHRGAVVSATLAVAALVAGVVVSTWQMVEARSQREEARAQAAKAEASRRFLNLVMTEVGADGAALTPAQLLDRGMHLLDAQYASDSRFMVDQLIQLADGYNEIEQVARQHEVLLRAESMAAGLGDDERLAEVKCNLVASEILVGDRARARSEHDAAHLLLARLARPLPLLRADCLQADAILAKADDHGDEAIATLRQVLALLERTGNTDHPSYAATLTRLAVIYNELGKPVESFDFNRRAGAALDAAGRGGSMSKIVTLNNEAAALVGFGELRRAAEVQAELLKRVDARGANPDSKISFTANYGAILIALGKPLEALPVLDDAMVQARAGKNVFWERRAMYQRARALIRTGRLDEGKRQLDEVEALYRQDPVLNKPWLRTVSATRAELLLGQGRPGEAHATMAALLADIGYPKDKQTLQLVSALPLAADIDLAAGDPAAAEPLLRDAIALARSKARDPTRSADLGKAWLALARVREARGDAAGARDALAQALASLVQGLGDDNPLTLDAQRRLAAHPAAPAR